MSETTDWYSGYVTPVRCGVYQRKFNNSIDYSYWDGTQWCMVGGNPQRAAQNHKAPSYFPHQMWRGLRKPNAN